MGNLVPIYSFLQDILREYKPIHLQIQATLPSTVPLILPARDSDHPDTLVLPEPSPAIQLTSLLGSAPSEHLQTLYSLYASQIATIVWTEEAQHGLDGQRRSVVVGLALNKNERDGGGETEVFESVMSMLHDLLVLMTNFLRS
ncbi:hypothetical protein CPB84DRAFT_1763076 [Gymnopilus junonius]|uniref:Uncharacterized protein n=1 Tax=Gymnopilus junonius TaxID=109634 RepID=A0A9P5NZZ5_GYMJU|nr:hypothetical protein CPB84DRAFT_1763076 [Gymnopilus junonius]